MNKPIINPEWLNTANMSEISYLAETLLINISREDFLVHRLVEIYRHRTEAMNPSEFKDFVLVSLLSIREQEYLAKLNEAMHSTKPHMVFATPSSKPCSSETEQILRYVELTKQKLADSFFCPPELTGHPDLKPNEHDFEILSIDSNDISFMHAIAKIRLPNHDDYNIELPKNIDGSFDSSYEAIKGSALKQRVLKPNHHLRSKGKDEIIEILSNAKSILDDPAVNKNEIALARQLGKTESNKAYLKMEIANNIISKCQSSGFAKVHDSKFESDFYLIQYIQRSKNFIKSNFDIDNVYLIVSKETSNHIADLYLDGFMKKAPEIIDGKFSAGQFEFMIDPTIDGYHLEFKVNL